YDPLLSDAINEALLLIPPKELDATAKKADVINGHLAAIERQAFEFAKEGKIAEAKKIIFSTEYETLKNSFNESMEKYNNLLLVQAQNDLKLEVKEENFSISILVFDFLALLIVWTITYKNVSFW